MFLLVVVLFGWDVCCLNLLFCVFFDAGVVYCCLCRCWVSVFTFLCLPMLVVLNDMMLLVGNLLLFWVFGFVAVSLGRTWVAIVLFCCVWVISVYLLFCV